MTTASVVITATDKTQAAFQSVSKNLEGIGSRMGVLLSSVAGLAGAAGFGMLIKNSMQTADALAKTSDALGIATEKLATLRYMGDLAGVSSEQMDEHLKKMTRSLGEAAQGGGAAAKTLAMLRLDTQQLIQLSPDQQYLAIADAINGLGTQAEKAAAASDIFGKSGINMLNVMADGSESFRQAEEEATRFGLAISRVDAAKIEMANDAFTRVGKVVEGMGNAMAITAAPLLEDIANKFVNLVGGADGFRNAAQFMTDVVLNAVGLLANGFHALHIVFDGIGAAFWTIVENLLKGLDWLQKQVVDFINILPGVDVKPMESLTAATNFAAGAAEQARLNLQNLAMQPLPSDQIKKWSLDVGIAAQAAAEKIASLKASAGGITDTPSADTATDPDVEKLRAKEDEKVLIEREAQERRRMNLQAYYMAEEEAERARAERIAEIQEQAAQAQIARGESAFSTMLGNVSSHNKTFFKIQKLYRMSKLAMEAPAAIADSYAWGASWGGPPAGATMAGIAALAMGAYASQLAGAQFGGSGGGSAAAGGSGNPVTSPIRPGDTSITNPPMQQQSSGSITINVNGVITDDIVQNLIVPAIQDAVDNRDVILIRGDSRNGQQLLS